MTDPHRKKRQLAQQLFEYPIPRDMKVKNMKKEIIDVINRLFPLYRGQYTVAEAVKVLQREEQELKALEQALETKKGDDAEPQDIESDLNNLTVDESRTETKSEAETGGTSETGTTGKKEETSEQKEVFSLNASDLSLF